MFSVVVCYACCWIQVSSRCLYVSVNFEQIHRYARVNICTQTYTHAHMLLRLPHVLLRYTIEYKNPPKRRPLCCCCRCGVCGRLKLTGIMELHGSGLLEISIKGIFFIKQWMCNSDRVYSNNYQFMNIFDILLRRL